jgi:hypothetical protein
MSHPFERWPRAGRRGGLLALISAALLMSIVLALLDSPLRASDEGGTVSLEVAASAGHAAD